MKPLLFTFVFAAAITSAAPVLTIDDASGRLGTVDLATGTVTAIGSTGRTFTDIAYSSTGILYGVTFSQLFTIDPTNAATTLIGNLGVGSMNSLVFGQDGTLYGAGGTGFYTVNPATGAATLVGSTGFGSAGDLAFNGGRLFLASTSGQLVEIDVATGSGTAIGNMGFGGSVYGLATASDGVLYGVSGTQIFSVNTTTGAGTLVRNYGGGFLGAAYGTSFFTEARQVPEIPEPATLLSMAGGLLLVGWRKVRSSRKVR